MGSAKYVYGFFLLLFTLIACEDVVEVELDDAPSQIVVDAWINNLNETQTIKLTRSQSYFENSFTEGINNASVIVSNDNGDVFVFEDQANGEYSWVPDGDATLGNPDDQFRLEIVADGKTIISETKMNPVAPIDSLQQEFRDDEVFGDDGIYCQFFARDLPGLGDSYWIKSFKNDVFLNKPLEINIAYDAAFDPGSEFDGFIFIPPIRELINEIGDNGIPVVWTPGDKLRVEIHSISNQAFAWMEIARDQMINGLNGIFAEPIANANGNMINNTDDVEILGIFNVAEISSMEITID